MAGGRSSEWGWVGPEELAEGDQVVVGVPVEAAADRGVRAWWRAWARSGSSRSSRTSGSTSSEPAEHVDDCYRQLIWREGADQQVGGALGVVVEQAGDAEGRALPPLGAVRAGRQRAECVLVDGLGVPGGEAMPLAAAEAVGELGEEARDGARRRWLTSSAAAAVVAPAFAVLVDQAGGESGSAGLADHAEEVGAQAGRGVVVQDAELVVRDRYAVADRGEGSRLDGRERVAEQAGDVGGVAGRFGDRDADDALVRRTAGELVEELLQVGCRVSARASVVTRRRRSPYGRGSIDRSRSEARMTPSCRITESAGATGLFEFGEDGCQLGQGVVRVEAAGVGEDPDLGRPDHSLLARPSLPWARRMRPGRR